MKGDNLPEKIKQDNTFCNNEEANFNNKTIPPKGDIDELIFPDDEVHYISER